jgi:hypothetical protein
MCAECSSLTGRVVRLEEQLNGFLADVLEARELALVNIAAAAALYPEPDEPELRLVR